MAPPESSDENGAGASDEEGFPWYVKAAILAAMLVVAFIVVIDVLELAGAL